MLKLTIITINLDNAEGLRKTIESVVSQTFTDYEYIVIDGASTDNSIDVIKQYEDQITYWVSEPDTGIYNAMNKGILKASGEYLQFLNSGDWLVDNSILTNIFISNVNVDILYGNVLLPYDENRIDIRKGCNREKLTLKDFVFDTICHQAAFIRRNLFENNGLYDESYKMSSDILFFAKAIVNGRATYKYIDISVSYFDPYGMGNEGQEEKRIALENLFSKEILDDYNYITELEVRINRLNLELNRYKHRFRLIDSFISRVKRAIYHFKI
ncbi:MAG: glycosyltransferase family 2 protein [Paludibacter sp.]|nr:glycosyltransferase family 2 protein [Paludibacter sp.]